MSINRQSALLAARTSAVENSHFHSQLHFQKRLKMIIGYLRKVWPRFCIWRVGGVNFPPCALFSYRMSSSHTTPLHGWGVCKGNQPGMSSRFPADEKFSLCLSLHQRALRPEIGAKLAFISWLKLFRPEGIDMQTGRFSAGLQNRPLSKKALAPFLIHFCVTYTMTPLSMVHVSVWLHWGCIGFKYAWIRPNPDIEMDGRMSPLQIFTLLMKETGDPCWGGQVVSLKREGNGCLWTDR